MDREAQSRRHPLECVDVDAERLDRIMSGVGAVSQLSIPLCLTYSAAHAVSNSVRLVMRLHFVVGFLCISPLRRRRLAPSHWNRL
jgi:hypothetical protein